MAILMSDMKFSCSVCRQRIMCDSECSGQETTCPTCHSEITVPHQSARTSPAPIPVLSGQGGFLPKRSNSLTACFIAQGAALTLSFDPAEVVQELRSALDKRLLNWRVKRSWVADC